DEDDLPAGGSHVGPRNRIEEQVPVVLVCDHGKVNRGPLGKTWLCSPQRQYEADQSHCAFHAHLRAPSDRRIAAAELLATRPCDPSALRELLVLMHLAALVVRCRFLAGFDPLPASNRECAGDTRAVPASLSTVQHEAGAAGRGPHGLVCPLEWFRVGCPGMEFLKGFATAALLVAGCAPSPLLRPDDATFAFADARFAAVSESILGQSGPRKLDVPEALFLRAEALYDYRFALTRGETASSYLAELAAAATD